MDALSGEREKGTERRVKPLCRQIAKSEILLRICFNDQIGEFFLKPVSQCLISWVSQILMRFWRYLVVIIAP